MGAVVSLAAAREERTPHWAGKCVCLGCRHEWEGVGPVGTVEGLQCPSCDLPKGVIKFPFGPAEGDAVLQCNCGCEALSAVRRKGRMWIFCMACGTDQTELFYDG